MFRCPSAGESGLVGAALAAGLWGCASAPAPPLPSETVRAGFGTVGVVAARYAPRDVYLTDAVIGKGAGAGKGAAAGAGWMLLEAGQAGLAGILLLPVLIPIGMAIGAKEGEEKAISDETARQIDTCIAESLLDPGIQQRSRDRVAAVAKAETDRPIVAIDDQGPTTPKEAVSYRNLADRGIDTVLEVSILEAGLAGGRGDHLFLQPFFLAQVRLVRVADDAEVFRRVGWYSAEHHPLFEFCADDGRVLQATLDRVYATMADAIVEEVFLTWRPGGED